MYNIEQPELEKICAHLEKVDVKEEGGLANVWLGILLPTY